MITDLHFSFFFLFFKNKKKGEKTNHFLIWTWDSPFSTQKKNLGETENLELWKKMRRDYYFWGVGWKKRWWKINAKYFLEHQKKTAPPRNAKYCTSAQKNGRQKCAKNWNILWFLTWGSRFWHNAPRVYLATVLAGNAHLDTFFFSELKIIKCVGGWAQCVIFNFFW